MSGTIQSNTHEVNGVDEDYFFPDPVGDIETHPDMDVDGQQVDYYSGPAEGTIEELSMTVNGQSVKYYRPNTIGFGPGAPIYTASAINLNETDEWLSLQGATTRLDLGTQTLSWSGWVNNDGPVRLFEKGSTTTGTETNSFRATITGSNKLVVSYTNTDPIFINQTWTSTATISSGKHFISIYDDRSSKTRAMKVYIDGVELAGGGSWAETGTFDSSTFDFTNSYTMEMGRLSLSGGGYTYTGGTAHLQGFIYGSSFTLADHQYLYNSGTPKCWNTVSTENPTLATKFNAYFDNILYNGRTELQALTDHVNGWVLDNQGSAVFNDSYLSIIC